MRQVILLLLLFLLFFSSFSLGLTTLAQLESNEVYVYQLTISHDSQLEIYNYTFIINFVSNGIVNFTEIITNENNGSSTSATYVFPLSKIKYLPYNGTVFDGYNLTFVGYTVFNGKNATEYKGYFLLNNLSIPVTAYYINSMLNYLNGSLNGYTVTLSLVNQYAISPLQNYTGYIVLAIVIIFIVVGVVLLVKIGKI